MGQGQRNLTETQSSGLTEVLSNYDAENLSDDDAKALVEEIKDLGIQRGSGLTEALGEAGIDARGLAQQAGISGSSGSNAPPEGGQGGGPGGPGGAGGGGGAKGPESAEVQTMQAVLEQLQASEKEADTDENFATLLLQSLEDAGLDTSQPIVDFRV